MNQNSFGPNFLILFPRWGKEQVVFVGELELLVPGAGVEPARPLGARDFKSLMSTSSITQAQGNIS